MGEKMDQRLSREEPRQDLRHLQGSHRPLPPVVPTLALPPQQRGVLAVWGMGRGVSGAQELVACPAEPGARRTLVMLGPACGCEAAVATKLLRRCSGPGLQNKLRVPSSKRRAGMDTRDRQAGSHPGPLDLLGSPGHCFWTCWEQEPGQSLV